MNSKREPGGWDPQAAGALIAIGEAVLKLAATDPQVAADLRRLAKEILRRIPEAETGGVGRDVGREQPDAKPKIADQVFDSGSGLSGFRQQPADSREAEDEREPAGRLREDRAADQLVRGEKTERPEAGRERSEPKPVLTLGQSVSPREHFTPTPVPRQVAEEDWNLSLIAQRLRLKAEAARWAATRRRRLAENVDFHSDIAPLDRDLIERARALPDCYLWMCTRHAPHPATLLSYEDLASAYENLSDAVMLAKQVQAGSDLGFGQRVIEQALELVAEAQSAVKSALLALDDQTDFDQQAVFEWLKEQTGSLGVYLSRHMRFSDLADAAQWQDLAARIEQFDGEVQETEQMAKKRRKLLGKVRHKASLISSGEGDMEESWRILIETVTLLVEEGLPPSHRQLRENLLPIVDDLPDVPDAAQVPESFGRVLREIDRVLASYPSEEKNEPARYSEDVQQVADLLAGGTIVVIGGEHRHYSSQALKDAFRLREVVWQACRDHQPLEDFQPAIVRPDVDLVLLAIRWTSHSYGELRQVCERYGKPFVRLPGGYNPNQVARQILEQASQEIRRRREPSS